MNKSTRVSLRNLSVLFVILVCSLLTLTLVSAEQTNIGLKKAGECIELIQTCSNCTSNNISSIILPNGTSVTYVGATMTRTDTYYNYTYCDTDATGKYIVNGWGDLDGLDTVWSYTFITTHNGKTDEFNRNFIIFMLGAAFVLLIFGMKMQNEYVGFMSGALFMLGGIYLMIYGFASITDLYTRGIAFTLIGFGALLGIAAGYKTMEAAKERTEW